MRTWFDIVVIKQDHMIMCVRRVKQVYICCNGAHISGRERERGTCLLPYAECVNKSYKTIVWRGSMEPVFIVVRAWFWFLFVGVVVAL